ncbi:LexA family protein [Aeromonas sp. YN13HZO-058]|uniref:LexA family protein n=1 Tax=Aeromonas TaxID=642 RepID=UPI000946F4CE|nr:S24 family peptidase [Aeromonas sp. YN13HZO-058]OLF19805.1 hypothetical protein BSP75_20650 [Aeromonas sp. YN13HZO-058]
MDEKQTQMARYEADKMAFAERLNLALDELGWPQRGRIAMLKRTLREDLSEISVRKWLRGEGLPEVKRLGELARITGKSVQWLLTGTDTGEGNVEPQPFPIYQVPLIAWVSAGEFRDCGDVPTLEEAEETTISPVRVGTRAYAVRVKGDSMVAPMGGKSYPDGTIIIVDPDVEPAPGKKVIARYGNDMTFKELVMDAGQWWLKPLNPQYPMLQVNEDVHICAVLVCSVMIE